MRPDPLPADTMARLRKWGYAPGRYMSDCHKCGKTHSGMDKRAITPKFRGRTKRSFGLSLWNALLGVRRNK